MNAIIPHKRRDGRSSFEDLIAYTSVRDDVQENELTEDSEIKSDVPHRNRFRRLVDYATRLRNEKFVSLIDVMKDGSQWVNFYGVTCFHNCNSLETRRTKLFFPVMIQTPFSTTFFPGLRMKARVLSSFLTVCVTH